jgi:predicted DNA-binding ribbon-helix-helix protein
MGYNGNTIGVGSKRKKVIISVGIDPAISAELNRLAALRECSVAELIREIINEKLKNCRGEE